MVEIIPGILEKDWAAIERKIELVKPFTNVIHIDIVDGKFAGNTSFLDPSPFKKYSDEIFFELHMMVDDPLQYIQSFADAGFKRFLGHVEKMSDVAEFVAEGQLLGEVGLAIDGKTSIDTITIPLDDLDNILIMTIQAGFSGQSFMPEYLEKVKTLRGKNQLVRGELFPIEVDGGITDQTIMQAAGAGATRFVTTSFLFGGETPQAQYQKLQACLQNASELRLQ